MADAILSGLVNDVLGRLTSLAIKEFGLVQGFRQDLLSLKDDFTKIKAVLNDAEQKHKNKAVDLWLKSLRSASLKMENVLDEVSAEAMLRKLHKELGTKYRVRAFFSSNHNPLMFRIKMAHKVKTIRRQFDDITAQKFKLNLTPSATSSVDEGVNGEMPYRETSSLIHASTIFGRNKEMETVTEQICSKDLLRKHDVSDIPVYAIWGMGGLGKTTLAQLVYNHERVTNHFELKCWMYVSENFQVKELIKGIIESIDKRKCKLSQLDELQKCVQEKLRGKRFLVVLDDVWIENSEKDKWEALSKTLCCGEEGSIVVMTTRSKTTSRMMARVPDLQHELGCLSEKDSWLLFKKFAFAEGREGGDIKELGPIGKKIVVKCKGLPLAVKTLGGLMWSKSQMHEWERVMDSDIWKLQEENILPSLKLSYNNLHPHLKRCFAYCCLFPKGHEMGKDVLILLWMANGLIPSRGEANWYVVGEEIYNCLVWRSFFQVVDKEYKMHDLMHDLAWYVMRHDCSIIEPGKDFIFPDEVLHLSLLSCPDLASLQPDMEKLKSLRSVFIFPKAYEGSVSHIYNHVYLRVLYLAGTGLETLPESICKLKHLKYLNLSRSKIKFLPESIIYLQNLQMLLLKGCWELEKLPEGIRYMRNLHYLDIDRCSLLRYLPVGIGKLTGLRRLAVFPVYKYDDGALIGELGYLNLIGSDLKLQGLEKVRGLKEARSANLKSKTHLLKLGLHWTRTTHLGTNTTHMLDLDLHLARRGKPENFRVRRARASYMIRERASHMIQDEEVLEGLEPNPSLEKLKIDGYMGRNISPSWMINLRSLVQIKMFNSKYCEHIPSLGKIPSLRVIKLNSMPSLKCFHDDETTTTTTTTKSLFPQLQELTISDCWELTNLPASLPKLKLLSLFKCGGLISLPDEIQSFKHLNEVWIGQCDNLSRRYGKERGVDWGKVSHIPHISIASPRY